MISGLNSPSADGFNFVHRVHRVNSQARQHPQRTPDEPQTRPAAESVVAADSVRAVREFSLLDLATRGFERILPELEALTHPVE